jgi:hypothetical protein
MLWNREVRFTFKSGHHGLKVSAKGEKQTYATRGHRRFIKLTRSTQAFGKMNKGDARRIKGDTLF